MANFKSHITTSTVLGIGYGGAAYGLFEVPLPACLLAGGLCSVSGMLPDLDSGASRPLRESVAFAAAVVPMMLVDRFVQFGMSTESMVLCGAAVYLAIRFGLARLLRRFTVHRGMFHSLPMMLACGGVAFLLASGPDLAIRYYKAGGVVLGFLSHLVLDEFYAMEWRRGRIRFKRSFGTALKVFGDRLLPNLLAYATLGAVVYLVVHEPGWMQEYHARQRELRAEERWAQDSLGAIHQRLGDSLEQVHRVAGGDRERY